MKNICLLITLFSLSLASNYLPAQTHYDPKNTETTANSLTLGREIPGYFSSPPGVDLLKNAITNPDGTRTIKAGQQTPEANEFNRKYCESVGARDVTNESDITIGPNTIYGAVCIGIDGKHDGSSVETIPGIGTERVFLPVPKH